MGGAWGLIPPVYTRLESVVAPVRSLVKVHGGGQLLTVGLGRLTGAATIDMMSRSAAFMKWDGRKQGLVPTDPPDKLAAIVLERRGQRPFAEVRGVSSTPGMRADGSISSATGLDPETGIHRELDAGLMAGLDRAGGGAGWEGRIGAGGAEEARAGLGLLKDLIAGYPWLGDVDRSVGLALILTLLCRGAVPVAPIFAVTAPTPGTGKSHFVDVASMIGMGTGCPAASVSEVPAETEKRLVGLVAGGYPMVLLDNVNGTLRSDLLSQAAERPRLLVRLLGGSELKPVENSAVFVVNGNALHLTGDLVRRTLQAHMDAEMEAPETRTFAFDPLERVQADRGAYVAAGLAVLRAHVLAGCPGSRGLRPLGSYGPWSRLVRGALVWLGEADPAVSVDKARASDPDTGTLRDMLIGWARCIGTDTGATIREAIDRAVSGSAGMAGRAGSGGFAAVTAGSTDAVVSDGRGDFLDALMRAAGARGTVDAQKLGAWISNRENRIIAGFRFSRDGRSHGVVKWAVSKAHPHLTIVN